MSDEATSEQRRSKRTSKSDALLWGPKDDAMRVGWLLEQSDTGLAFAWRGAGGPRQGELIRLHSAAGSKQTRLARVKRITHAHDDLIIVAAERIDAPDAGAAVACEIDLKRTTGSSAMHDMLESVDPLWLAA